MKVLKSFYIRWKDIKDEAKQDRQRLQTAYEGFEEPQIDKELLADLELIETADIDRSQPRVIAKVTSFAMRYNIENLKHLLNVGGEFGELFYEIVQHLSLLTEKGRKGRWGKDENLTPGAEMEIEITHLRDPCRGVYTAFFTEECPWCGVFREYIKGNPVSDRGLMWATLRKEDLCCSECNTHFIANRDVGGTSLYAIQKLED